MQIIDISSEKSSSATAAYEEMLRRLRSGKIGPDDRIVDKSLATELKMSRMPAREALLRLVNEGYLVGTTRGFKLPSLSTRDILEVFEIRLMLEPRAAASAAVPASGISLAALERAARDASTALSEDKLADLIDANGRFRAAWLAAVPNRRLAATIARFFEHVNAVRCSTLQHDQESRALSVSIGAALLDGFKRRDALYVHDQMCSYIDAARSRFLALNAETNAVGSSNRRKGKRSAPAAKQIA